MKFGLSLKVIDLLSGVFEKTPDLQAVYIYGHNLGKGEKKIVEIDLVTRFDGKSEDAGHLGAIINDLLPSYKVSVVDESVVAVGGEKSLYEETKKLLWQKDKKLNFDLNIVKKIIKIASHDIRQQVIKIMKDEDKKNLDNIKAEILAITK